MDLNHKATITTTEHILSGILPANDRKIKVLKFNSEYSSRNFINIYIINIINNFEFSSSRTRHHECELLSASATLTESLTCSELAKGKTLECSTLVLYWPGQV